MRRTAAWAADRDLTLAGSAAAGTEAPAGPLDAELRAVVAAGSPGALVLVDGRRSRVEAASGLAASAVACRFAPATDSAPAASRRRSSPSSCSSSSESTGCGSDDTVERWLPGLRPGRRSHHRCATSSAHTSGLADYAGDEGFLRRTAREPRRRWTPRELVAQSRLGRAGARPAGGSPTQARTTSCSASWSSASPGRRSESSFAGGSSIHSGCVTRASRPARRFPAARERLRAERARRDRRQPGNRRDRSEASASWAWAAGRDRLDRTRSLALPRRAPPRTAAPARLLAQMRPRRIRATGWGSPPSDPCGTRDRPHRQPARHRLRCVEQSGRASARRRDDEQLSALAGRGDGVPAPARRGVLRMTGGGRPAASRRPCASRRARPPTPPARPAAR